MDRTPLQIVDRAIRILNRCGWTRGTMHDEATGAYCAVGALRAAAYGMHNVNSGGYRNYEFDEAVRQVTAHLPTEHRGHSLMFYNDTRRPRDGKKMILRVFMKAKETLEKYEREGRPSRFGN